MKPAYWIVSAYGEKFVLEVEPGDADACWRRIAQSDFRWTADHSPQEIERLPEIKSSEWLRPLVTTERTPS